MIARRRRLAAWLATFAMALNALWPLISQAKPDSVILVPVCTIGGETHYEELPAGKTPLEQQSASHLEHCSYCFFTVLPNPFAPAFAAKSVFQGPSVGKDESFETATPFSLRSRAPPVLLSMSDPDRHHRRHHEEGIALRHRGARAGAADDGLGELRLGVLHD